MSALRRALYVQAAVWAIAGIALAVAPGVLGDLFGLAFASRDAWVRLLGIQTFGLALLMVLVAQRLEELWWWAWAFALITALWAAVVVLNAAFGLDAGEGKVAWWAAGGLHLLFAFGLLYGLASSARERPLP